MPTSSAYRNNCTRPRILDSVKTTYLDKIKPIGKLTLKEIINAAICGEMVTTGVYTGSFKRMKL